MTDAWGYITDPSGMLQLGARYYWPEVGRFVSQDPIGDGVNWYIYAEDNPLVWVDPTGECFDWVGDMDWGDAFDFADWKKKEVRFWGCMVRRQLGDDIVGLLKHGAGKIGLGVAAKYTEGTGYVARHNAQRMNDIWERGKDKPRQTPGRIKKLQNLRTRALWLKPFGDDLVRWGKLAGKASLAVTAGMLVYDYGKCFGNLQ